MEFIDTIATTTSDDRLGCVVLPTHSGWLLSPKSDCGGVMQQEDSSLQDPQNNSSVDCCCCQPKQQQNMSVVVVLPPPSTTTTATTSSWYDDDSDDDDDDDFALLTVEIVQKRLSLLQQQNSFDTLDTVALSEDGNSSTFWIPQDSCSHSSSASSLGTRFSERNNNRYDDDECDYYAPTSVVRFACIDESCIREYEPPSSDQQSELFYTEEEIWNFRQAYYTELEEETMLASQQQQQHEADGGNDEPQESYEEDEDDVYDYYR